MNDKIPAISIIIPLYNAEKYISQCLGSILSQTFQDFEVIVVDDCSTDNSIYIIENLISKFDGRLRLIRRKKNSGGPAIPRNIGLGFARGKYISFIDNDDIFLNNALKDFFEIAEKMQADVVHAEKYLTTLNNVEDINKNTKFVVTSAQNDNFVDKPIFETEDLLERINLFNKKRFWYVWNKLFRRDFLIENQIYFPNVIASDDMLFSFYTLCLAKNYVRIPNIVNIYRNRYTSLSHEKLSIENYVHKWTSIIIKVAKNLNEFMNHVDFFIQNPECKFIAFERPIQDFFSYTKEFYKDIPDYKINLLIQKEFSNNPDNNVELTTYMFSLANIFHIKLNQFQQQIVYLKQQIKQLKENIRS